MTNETPKFRWPVPAWNADWQKWQGVFRDLSTNIDATVFSAVDSGRLMLQSLPNSSIIANGPGYDLLLDGPFVIRSRTHNVAVTVPAGATSLTADSVLALTITPGAVGAQSVEWETYGNGIGSSPDIVQLGYVDSSYNITWWNGVRLFAGAGILPLFGRVDGGSGGMRWSSGTVSSVSVVSGGTAIGSFGVTASQGLVSSLLAYVQTGSTDDVDVELGDSSFSGSPNILYQIGQNESLEGLWDPDTNGNWSDRNAWGFSGLTSGLLYYRFTNNGPNTITMGIDVEVVGKEI